MGLLFYSPSTEAPRRLTVLSWRTSFHLWPFGGLGILESLQNINKRVHNDSTHHSQLNINQMSSNTSEILR